MTVDDVEGFLLSFVDSESFEALSVFDGIVGVGHLNIMQWRGRT